VVLNREDRQTLNVELFDEVTGLGPLEPLLKDPDMSTTSCERPQPRLRRTRGQAGAVGCAFKDERHLLRIIDKIVSAVGRRVDESNPYVDARLKDGSRFNAMVPPVAVDGSLVSIRKFKKDKLGIDDLVKFGAFSEEMAAYLQAAVATRLNVIVSGGTGSGKTTTLNALSSFIDNKERILTIEDTAELQLQQVHVGRMESRPPNVEGKGAVTQRDCLRNALRMRPDRIIVGETRGEEVIDMLQAMNTGHDGSMTTIHANSPATPVASGKHGRDVRDRDADQGRARPDRERREPHRAGQPPAGRLPPDGVDHRSHRHGRRGDLHAGGLPLPAHRA
jgi:pilus assembly protein CpaF